MLIIKIKNDGTGDVQTGNYTYQVLINDTVIESGEIKEIKRRRGWQELIAKLARESKRKQRAAANAYFDEINPRRHHE